MSSTGRATALWIASTLAAAVLAFSASQQLERVERDGHVAGENLEELQVAFAERPRLGAFDVERAGHPVVQHDGHGERAAGALRRLRGRADPRCVSSQR